MMPMNHCYINIPRCASQRGDILTPAATVLLGFLCGFLVYPAGRGGPPVMLVGLQPPSTSSKYIYIQYVNKKVSN